MKVNNVRVYAEGIVQDNIRCNGASHDKCFGTVLNVLSEQPIITNEPFLTVSESGSDILDNAQFYIGSMHFVQPSCYRYRLVGVELLPMIGKVGGSSGKES